MPATVISSTLQDTLGWPDATIVSGDAVDIVARLKEESDVPLRSQASLSLNRALMAAGLVDRLQVTIFPVISGRTGTSPILGGAGDFDLDLLECRTLDGHNGCLRGTTYGVAGRRRTLRWVRCRSRSKMLAMIDLEHAVQLAGIVGPLAVGEWPSRGASHVRGECRQPRRPSPVGRGDSRISYQRIRAAPGRMVLQDGWMAELILFADYYQIHVFDDGSQTDLGDAWTEQAVADRLAIGHDAAAVGTTVNVNIMVAVEVLDAPPTDDSLNFDHVAEGSIHSASGKLVVMGCTDYEPEARRFPVLQGWLRLRASRSNLDSAFRADIDSDESAETMERLRLEIWPGAFAPPVVAKRWQAPAV